ncbi:hypothetical protein [Paenibacillus lutrae]|uniref:Uncharacterized protein n=1 Tax=Paenibacillus lutrae TaxID=2078573 RepID=A0A7X3FLU3_9BACL|nr:hypothetical protein [Paenibacillus lutrae]MVP02086.1 hypothetical protein [Paenibacillus lutrae]
MKDAFYVSNNGYDAILLRYGFWLQVSKDVFRDYIDTDAGKYFSGWHGTDSWEELNKEIALAAEKMGEVLAYYQDGELIVTDPDRFERRKEFFLGE